MERAKARCATINLDVEAIPAPCGCRAGVGASGLRQHRSCRRHGDRRGDATSLAAAGAQPAHPCQAARPPGSWQSAAARLGCRYAGSHSGPAAPAQPLPRISIRHWPRPAAASRRPHLCQPFGAGDTGRARMVKPSRVFRFPSPTRWNRCAPRRMQASTASRPSWKPMPLLEESSAVFNC